MKILKRYSSSQWLLGIGIANVVLAVLCGAIIAPLFLDHMSTGDSAIFQVAVEFHMAHALGLIMLGVIAYWQPQAAILKWVAALFLCGILLGCGGLFVFSAQQLMMGMYLAFFGGMSFLLGWLTLVLNYFASPYSSIIRNP